MDAYEATRTVLSRIQSLDPDNASKIMGLLLLQGQSEKDMIRLAFGPQALLHSVVLRARKDLGLSSPTGTTTTTARHILTNNISSSPSWAPPNFSDFQNLDDVVTPNSTSSASYSSILHNSQLIDDLSFLNDAASSTIRNTEQVACPTATDAMLFHSYAPPSWGQNHRRTLSFTDACVGSDASSGSELGWKPCLYYARGYCNNGTSCKFLHGLPDSADNASIVGSPAKLDAMEQCQQELLMLRSKSQQHRRSLNAASQIFCPASGKCASFLLQQQQQYESQRASVASLMLGEDVRKFGRNRIEKNENLGNAGSRQIYLTFPADSTFREEDVSNYFSIYGPVQDVRIPFQQKRMFGFVTFVYPETVKLILAKGNPHFVCDARVLVKPYKEKGKVPDKKQQQQQQQQQVERGELSPNGLDSRDPYDLLQHSMQSSPRLLYNTQDLLWRRKLKEQAELEQAMELQSRRLMGLQLVDMNKDNQHRRNLSIGAAPIFSPAHSHSHAFVNQPEPSSPKSPEENGVNPAVADSAVVVDDQNLKVHSELSGDINGKEETSNHDYCNIQDSSLEHNLPDSPFASPTKRGGDSSSFFSTAASVESKHQTIGASSFSSGDNNLIASSLLPATSTLEMASYNSCLFQMPRFFSGHGAIQM